jgi:anti-sigma regulatory factor (Ser/Thr protein kinase)
MIPERAGDAVPGPWQDAGARARSPGRPEIDRTTLAARPAHLEGRVGSRWLMLAAEMAGLVSSTRRSSPDPVAAAWACGPRIATRTLGAEAGSVRTARDFTVATLRRWGTAERSQDIAIVVSELLTNALRHGRPGSGDIWPRRPIRLGLLQPGPCVLLAVADPGKTAPAPQRLGSLAETGRGLHIICALSDQWGYTTPSDKGKVVWAMFYRALGARGVTSYSSPTPGAACSSRTKPPVSGRRSGRRRCAGSRR